MNEAYLVISQKDIATGHELLEQLQEETCLLVSALELHELTGHRDDHIRAQVPESDHEVRTRAPAFDDP